MLFTKIGYDLTHILGFLSYSCVCLTLNYFVILQHEPVI